MREFAIYQKWFKWSTGTKRLKNPGKSCLMKLLLLLLLSTGTEFFSVFPYINNCTLRSLLPSGSTGYFNSDRLGFSRTGFLGPRQHTCISSIMAQGARAACWFPRKSRPIRKLATTSTTRNSAFRPRLLLNTLWVLSFGTWTVRNRIGHSAKKLAVETEDNLFTWFVRGFRRGFDY